MIFLELGIIVLAVLSAHRLILIIANSPAPPGVFPPTKSYPDHQLLILNLTYYIKASGLAEILQ